jgi:hypothetical protein
MGVLLSFLLRSYSGQKWPDSRRISDLLDQGLLAIREDGTYKKLEQKWEKPNP